MFIDNFTPDPREGKREELQMFFLPSGNISDLFWMGKGIEDMGISMNPQTREADDVQGNYVFEVQTYRKSIAIDPLNLDGTDPYSVEVSRIILGEKRGRDCELDFLIVCLPMKDTSGNSYAYRQIGTLSMDTLAPGVGAINMPHSISLTGEKIEGTFNESSRSFTPAT